MSRRTQSVGIWDPNQTCVDLWPLQYYPKEREWDERERPLSNNTSNPLTSVFPLNNLTSFPDPSQKAMVQRAYADLSSYPHSKLFNPSKKHNNSNIINNYLCIYLCVLASLKTIFCAKNNNKIDIHPHT